ncbi:hypothetical protein PLICRDRAFT_118115 [Plicaturopsis crispa FD-325 SS-3]|uniref:Unplaced genomic scaffold PLICRscaffold_18, whole genome shotgun sequence n=1 Tax=Plicaturopsis crispa FD-325 SS-3 TaxID=944288 RepID=A0A0C9SXG4_PLICR|nr:hypothetical protein PLICRDRAFT_118115 [Plicaturopsis crispa FD-325 SS-3]
MEQDWCCAIEVNRVKILVINPNSSRSITSGLRESLLPLCSRNVALVYFTGSARAPASIDDETTAVMSAAVCYADIRAHVDWVGPMYDAYLVACFSDHPLTRMLKEGGFDRPIMGIFEAAISHALLVGSRFGIITTGVGWRNRLTDAVRAFLGAGGSDRFLGVEPTGLGVLELHDQEPETVARVKEAAKALAQKGADVIILGCAGMSGMEAIVRDGARAGGAQQIAVVDGAKAAVELLTGLSRQKYFG